MKLPGTDKNKLAPCHGPRCICHYVCHCYWTIWL